MKIKVARETAPPLEGEAGEGKIIISGIIKENRNEKD